MAQRTSRDEVQKWRLEENHAFAHVLPIIRGPASASDELQPAPQRDYEELNTVTLPELCSAPLMARMFALSSPSTCARLIAWSRARKSIWKPCELAWTRSARNAAIESRRTRLCAWISRDRNARPVGKCSAPAPISTETHNCRLQYPCARYGRARP